MAREEVLQVRMSNKEMDQLEYVKDKASFPSASEAVRYCIRLVSDMYKQKEEGEK